ncbi:unnamed protein product, partial [Clonostachys chloroleuca]
YKSDYKKIKFYTNQARQDSLVYFWVFLRVYFAIYLYLTFLSQNKKYSLNILDLQLNPEEVIKAIKLIIYNNYNNLRLNTRDLIEKLNSLLLTLTTARVYLKYIIASFSKALYKYPRFRILLRLYTLLYIAYFSNKDI